MIIRLADVPVGTLRRKKEDSWAFETFSEYRSAEPRPVLGQLLEDDLEAVWRSKARLPPFFSNLLPESPLRELVARSVGVRPEKEGILLSMLGQDLPGAVIVELEEGENLGGENLIDSTAGLETEGAQEEGNVALKFSLAGVQLKLSGSETGRGLTVSASGQDGDWIIKLPSPSYVGLPEVESSILSWATAAGFDVPAHRLVQMAEIQGLPANWPLTNGAALAVSRYDRPEAKRRVHQEDFAQVLGLYPDWPSKYKAANYGGLGRVVLAVTGQDGLDEYVRRLIFMVLSGNGDAHVKNWSLIYPDGITAKLSPLYDQVFTRTFIDGDELALNLGGEKDFYRISLDTFRRFARKVRTDPERVARVAAESAERVREAWRTVRSGLPLEERIRRQIDDHLGRVRL